APVIRAHDVRGDAPQVACERDEADARALERGECLAGDVFLRPARDIDHARLDARARRALERARSRPVADDELDARGRSRTRTVEVIDQRLEVGAAARREHGDAGAHARPPPNCGVRNGFATRSWPTVV